MKEDALALPLSMGDLGPHRFAVGHNISYQRYKTDRQRSDSIGRTVFGRPFVKRFTLCYQTVVLPRLSCLSVSDVRALHCGQTVGGSR